MLKFLTIILNLMNYWFIEKKPCTETRENVYIMTMVSREPRQIVGFDIAFDKSPERIQDIVDNAPDAEYYCTDGYNGYIDIAYPGKHIRNIQIYMIKMIRLLLRA